MIQRHFQKKPFWNDPRSKRFSHDALFGTITSFPPTLGRLLRPVENQKNSVRCTAYGTAVNGGYIHGARFHPDWQAAKIGQLQRRSVDVNGGDPNATMKSQRDYGYAPYESIPTAFSLERNSIENTGMDIFGTLYDLAAEPYKAAGFVKVDGPLDLFDDVKSALVQAYDKATGKGACVQAFGRWYQEWTNQNIIKNGYENFEGYHHYLFVDFETINGIEYLIAQNSYGENVGEDGFHRFPRDIVNREFSLSGTSLKIMKIMSPSQLALARQETPYGALQRLIIRAWYIISNLYV